MKRIASILCGLAALGVPAYAQAVTYWLQPTNGHVWSSSHTPFVKPSGLRIGDACVENVNGSFFWVTPIAIQQDERTYGGTVSQHAYVRGTAGTQLCSYDQHGNWYNCSDMNYEPGDNQNISSQYVPKNGTLFARTYVHGNDDDDSFGEVCTLKIYIK